VHALRERQHDKPERQPAGTSARLLLLRTRVWWRATELDRQLAEGIPPAKTPELSMRAAQLTTLRHRELFATSLEAIVAAAREPRRRSRACVPLDAASIIAAQDDLLALATALRSRADFQPHAAALVSFLLCDVASPLHHAHAPATPAHLARDRQSRPGAALTLAVRSRSPENGPRRAASAPQSPAIARRRSRQQHERTDPTATDQRLRQRRC
jgi:hypothetical protein